MNVLVCLYSHLERSFFHVKYSKTKTTTVVLRYSKLNKRP